MTTEFIFWAQALDNLSPDHIEMHGEVLSEKENKRREDAVSLVSDVVKRGRCIFKKDGVQLTADDQHFVLEALSAQRDQAGRIAPILCYGYYGNIVNEDIGCSAAGGLKEFSNRIERTLPPGQLDLLQSSFEVLKKKFLSRMVWRTVGYAAIASLIAMIGVASMGIWLGHCPIYWGSWAG